MAGADTRQGLSLHFTTDSSGFVWLRTWHGRITLSDARPIHFIQRSESRLRLLSGQTLCDATQWCHINKSAVCHCLFPGQF